MITPSAKTNAFASPGTLSRLDSVLIDLVSAAVYVCEAPTGRILQFNRRAVELWGRVPQSDADSEIFCGSYRLLRPDGSVLPHSEGPMARALQSGVPVRDQRAIMERPDGSRIHVTASIDFLRDEQEQIVAAVNMFQDVSDLRQAELAVVESEQRFRTFLDKLPAGAYTCDAQGLITYFNPMSEQIWGRAPKLNDSADRFCGSFRLYLPDGTRLSHSECWMALALRDQEEYLGHEILIERDDDSRRLVLAHASPTFNDQQELTGAINILVDITAQKQIEEKLRQREQHLQATIEATPVCVKVVAADGTIEEMNPAGLKMFEAESDQFNRISVFDLIVPEHRESFRQLHERVCRGENGTLEFDIIGLAGTRRTLETHAVALPSVDGQFKQLAITRDVGEPKRNETLLRRQKQALELIARGESLHTILETLCLIIEEQAERAVRADILLVDPTGETLVQGAAPNLPEDYSRAIDGIRIEPDVGTCCVAAYRGEPVVTPDIENDPAWEAYRHLPLQLGLRAAWSSPIISSQGKVLGTIGTYFFEKRGPTDSEKELVEVIGRTAALAIEHKQAEECLKRRAEAMVEADRRKDEFLATLAHELRNPLAPLTNSLELLNSNGNLSDDVRHLHQLMQSQTQHLVRLVDDLLEVSRVTRGKIELRPEPLDLNTIVQNAAEIALPQFDAKQQSFVVDLVPDPLMMNADPVRLTQVVTNLLTNAGKYTPSRGRIALSTEIDNQEAVLIVRDNGPGIPTPMLDRIFDMFTQVDQSTTRAQSGLGIGLTLVRQFVEMHQGHVEARSLGAGTGTEFIVRLPLESNLAIPSETRVSPCLQPDAAIASRRILVVDDTRAAAILVGKLLERLGQSVRVVHGGQAAIEAARTFHPDLIISDIAMPGMDGYELARQLKSEMFNGVLVALTGYGQQSDRALATEAGFDRHLVKPVSLDTLASLLAET